MPKSRLPAALRDNSELFTSSAYAVVPPPPPNQTMSYNKPSPSSTSTSTSAPTPTLPSFSTNKSTTPALRLQSITGHMSSSSTTSFPADAVPQAPEDPLFGLMAAYRADTFDKKVDLGIGAYRDDNAKPWVLPVVKKVIDLLNSSNSLLTIIFRPTRSLEMTPP
jgi:hypothetical protein